MTNIAEILEAEPIERRVEIILGSSDPEIPRSYLMEAVRYLDREKGDQLRAARLSVIANDFALAHSLYDLAVKNMWFKNSLDEADKILEEAKAKNVFTEAECYDLKVSGRSFCSSSEC